MKKRTCLFIIALLAILAFAGTTDCFAMTEYTTKDGSFTYTTDNYLGECTIVKYNGTAATVTIPRSIDSCKVTCIDNGAFYKNETLTEVTLPSSIRTIGANAFHGCTELEKVNGLEKVKEFGEYAFAKTKLKSADLSGAQGFLGEGLFNGCTSLKKVALGEKVTDIGAYAFSGCSALSKIDTSKVKSFGEFSFYKCTALKKASFANAVRFWSDAFNGSGLTSVKIPKTVTTLDPNCFSYCMSLKKVVLNFGKEMSYGIRSLRTDCQCWTFAGCRNLKNVTIGKNVSELGYKMFADTGIESITIPANTKCIDETTFADCKNLKDVYFLGDRYDELGVDTGSKVTVHGKKGSSVQKLAKEYKVKFVAK